jgi:hypothetical protein
MTVDALRACLLAVIVLAVAGQVHAAGPDDGKLKIFSGKPRLIVVNGYSTSFHWPRILQRKLDRHFNGRRVIEVKTATKGGTPIAKWIDVKTGRPLPPWEQVVRPALKAKGDRPAVVLAQQSLQWAFGERTEGIENADDKARIKQGADAMQKYVELMIADGADLVLLAAHIYKRPMEPQIGNERLALAELVARKIPKVHAGPDVWEPTRKQYPKAFARDGVHPNSIGAEIMAQLWFETLLVHDGLEVPEWSRNEMQEAIRSEPQAPQRRKPGERREPRRGRPPAR